jgi:hypothetical protein
MSDRLPPDIENLLGAEKNRDPLASDVVDAAWLGVQKRMALPAPSAPTQPGAAPSLANRLLTLGGGVLLGIAGTLVFLRATTSPPPAILSAAPRVVIVNVPPSAAPAPALPDTASVPRPSALPSSSLVEGGLAAERALIDRARAALARGDTAATERAVELHRSRFPKGQLSEEREAIAIRALRASGRSGEAKQREADFARTYPDSVFSPALSTDGG